MPHSLLFVFVCVLFIYLFIFFNREMEWKMSFEDDGVPIGLTLHECMLMAAVFSAADEVATLSLIKQVRNHTRVK